MINILFAAGVVIIPGSIVLFTIMAVVAKWWSNLTGD